MKIKNNLQKYRLFLNYTQYELSKMTKIPISSLRNIEKHGHYPKYQKRVALCSIFGISQDQLFYVETEESENIENE